MENIIAEQYLHIGNSGVTFQVVDMGHGPTIRVLSSSLGNMVHQFTLHVRPENLTALGEMFKDAAGFKFSQQYCNVTEPSRVGRGVQKDSKNWNLAMNGKFLLKHRSETVRDTFGSTLTMTPEDEWLSFERRSRATVLTLDEAMAVIDNYPGAALFPVAGVEYLPRPVVQP